MLIIGIIAKRRDVKAIQKDILKINKDIQIIEINEKSLKNLKNVKFEAIVVGENMPILINSYEETKRILENAKCLIVNSDEKISMPQNNIKTITYGFNHKATVTISSIKEDCLLVCIQRNIEKEDGKMIEIQERNIKLEDVYSKKIYNILINCILIYLYNLKM